MSQPTFGDFSAFPRKTFGDFSECPKVREAIKYLVKDHRYDYIETGSLLSIRKNTRGIVIPSEETRLTLYPMDYEEFRWALDDDVTTNILRETFIKRNSLGDAITRKLMRDFRLYMLVGGMPQAVRTYIETNNLTEVDNKKKGDSGGKVVRLPGAQVIG